MLKGLYGTMPTRRSVLAGMGTLTGGLAGLGWLTADPCGEITMDSPAYDLDGDGLFEDVTGDRELTYKDPLAYSHEGVWEEITGEAVGHAFDYSDGGGWAGNLEALTDYTLQSEHDGMWTYSGEPIDLTFHRLPGVSPLQAEHATHLAETALNNAATRTDGDWYTDITVNETGPQQAGLQQEYDTMTELGNDVGQIIARTDGEPSTHNAVLYPSGDPNVYAPDTGNWAVMTGMSQLSVRDGTPLFTRDRATVLPARAAGMALGMEEHGRSASVMDDEFPGDVFVAFGPMDTYTLEDYREDVQQVMSGSETGAASDGTEVVETNAYVTVFFDPALESAVGGLE